MFSQWFRNLVCCAALLVLCSLCFGQGSTGDIVGTVTDPSGGVIPKASVTLTNTQTGVVLTSSTNGAGEYRFQFLQPGNYNLTVEAPGFEKYTQQGFNLAQSHELRIDAAVRPGSVSQTLIVQAQTPLLHTDDSMLSTTIETKDLQALPIPNRDPQQLQQLLPGVVQDPQGQFVGNGGIEYHNAYFVDGTPNNHNTWGGNPVNPNPDVISEFTVLTNNFSAEYGNSGNIIMLSTIKSGTNQFHGTLFEFLQNTDLQAGNYYNHSVNKNIFNRFGGTLGGPIIKNKTFFFIDTQITRQANATFANNITVPTSAFKSGDFTSLLGPQTGTDPLGRPVYQGEIFNPFSQRQVTDPASGNLVWVRDPFPTMNVIPASMLSPAALKLQSLYPNPTAAGNFSNFSYAAPSGNQDYEWDIKVDQNFTDKDRLSVRFSHDDFFNLSGQPLPNPLAGGGFASLDNPTYQASLNYVHTFSPTMTNQLIGSWSQYYDNRGSAGFGVVSPSYFGINGFPAASLNVGTPIISFTSGFQQLGSSGGSLLQELDHDVSIYDNFTWVRGRHTIKLGGMWRTVSTDSLQPNSESGDFTFSNLFTNQQFGSYVNQTGSPYASFLLGVPQNFTYNLQPDFFRTISNVGGAFVQDDFRVNDRLTLNLGLRWDNWFWPTESQNRWGLYNLASNQLVRAGTNGMRTSLYRQTSGVWSPRVGFAYRPFKSLNTVIRSGFGIFALGNLGVGGSQQIPETYFFLESDAGHYATVDQIHWKTTLDNIPQYPSAITQASQLHGSSVTADPGSAAHPYEIGWNFDIQHQIKNLLLDGAYVASRGVHLPYWGVSYGVNINSIPIAEAPLAQGNFTAPWIPYPQFPGGVDVLQNNGSSTYNSLQLKAEQRYSKGLTFVAAYTWSKLIQVGNNSTGGEFGTPFRDPLNNWKLDRGPSVNNIPERFSLGFNYDIPVGKGRQFGSTLPKVLDYMIGGWAFSSIFVAQSGHSLTVVLPTDPCQCGNGVGYPNLLHPLNNPHTNAEWFDTSAFAVPAQYHIGNAGQGIFLGPGFFNVNATLAKKFKVTERWQFELRGEAYNLTNSFQPGDPNATYNAPGQGTFGQITSTGAYYNPRYLQIAAKLYF